MTKRMLVDATHPEETRVAIVDSYRDINRLDDLDFGLASKPILRGNIYLAKVMRVEPSLQAAFVEYGGNRHGFLPFTEIHPDYFRIPMADRPADEEPEEPAPPETEEDEQALFAADMDDDDREYITENDTDSDPGTAPDEQAPAAPPADDLPPAAPEPVDHFVTDPGIDVGLITDFGNAAIIPNHMDEAVPQEPTPVDSVGGDVAERFVRQHRPRYKIQEVLKRGQVMLIQVVKEERGNKGAALTTFLSLAGRYCVLMPNTDHGGGVSRKITNHQDRRRMKEILDQLAIPEGMAVILRTAGMEQDPPDIQRDLEYLLRLWDSIREQTLQSSAPALIYEEANLIKRSVRDLYTPDIQEILVAGAEGYNRALEFMRTIMPDQVEKIKLYDDPIPLFFRYHVENQIDGLHSPTVQLRSGGYIVINPTEALVSIDVNSGRATRERHIEETALKTNLEAADEIARQLRLRDLAGLVVIDFIDMEDGRNNAAVERRLKEAMKNDRARLQIGRISLFGLLELSRQRLRPSLLEINFEKCPHCAGVGYVRSVDSAALSVLRAIEEEGIRQRAAELVLNVPTKIALYILNQKREALTAIEQRYDLHVLLHSDDTLVPPDYKLERTRNRAAGRTAGGPAVNTDQIFAEAERDLPPIPPRDTHEDAPESGNKITEQPPEEPSAADNAPGKRRRFRQSGRENRNGGFGRNNRPPRRQPQGAAPVLESGQPDILPLNDITAVNENSIVPGPEGISPDNQDNQQRRRRRGRRGGRHRNSGEGHQSQGGKRWGQNHPGGAPQPYEPPSSVMNVNIPASIHDIDTTPREPAPARQAPKGAPVSRSSNHGTSSSPHEIVNPTPDKPKGGWWRRFTGQ
jgi:ribonuclease E